VSVALRALRRHRTYPNSDAFETNHDGCFWPEALATAVQHSAAIRGSADMPLVSPDRRG
jgi:hypothetical protein